MPTEAEMLPKDKYTMFDRKEKRYRKGIHSTFPLGTPLADWMQPPEDGGVLPMVWSMGAN